jgi:hypothetical protein
MKGPNSNLLAASRMWTKLFLYEPLVGQGILQPRQPPAMKLSAITEVAASASTNQAVPGAISLPMALAASIRTTAMPIGHSTARTVRLTGANGRRTSRRLAPTMCMSGIRISQATFQKLVSVTKICDHHIFGIAMGNAGT